MWNLLKCFPFKPKMIYKGKVVTPTYRELHTLFKASDYLSRVINQEEAQGLTRNQIVEICYTFVKDKQNYKQLVAFIGEINETGRA